MVHVLKSTMAGTLSLSLFLLLTLLTSSWARKSSSSSEPASSNPISLNDRVQQLLDLKARRPVIKMSSANFLDLVRGSPRNYSVIVMFTALQAHRGCAVCNQASEEFSLVASSYRYSQFYSSKLFFAMIDFDDGAEAFQSMNINSAPVFMHFPPKGRLKKVDSMDIQRVGFSGEAIARWIYERTDMNIRLFRPPNYTGTMALLILITLVGGLVYLRRNNLEFLFNKNTWSMLAMFFVLSMVSGQMWNHIRGPPFVHKMPQGGVSYIHGSSQSQFVMETYFVMALYGLVVVGMVLLCEAGDEKAEPGLRRMQAVAGLGITCLFYSLVLSIFRSKAGGYPYSFLIK